MMVLTACLENKAAVAIRAFDEILVAHFQIHFGMAQGPTDTFAGDTAGLDLNDFGGFDGHGRFQMGWDGADHTS